MFLKHPSSAGACLVPPPKLVLKWSALGFLPKPIAQLWSLLPSQDSRDPKLLCDTACSAWNSLGGAEV